MGRGLPPKGTPRRRFAGWAVHTGVSQYLAQRVTIDVYALSLPQQFAQMRVVDSRVSGPRQDHHVGRQRVRCSVGRSATSIAVSECGCSLLAVTARIRLVWRALTPNNVAACSVVIWSAIKLLRI